MALFSVLPESSDPRKAIGKQIASMLQNFLSRETVSSGCDREELIKFFSDTDCGDQAAQVESYLDYLERLIIPHSINVSSPRCLGHMTGPVPSFAWWLGSLMIALNQNLVKHEAAKSLTLLERQTIAMIHRLIYGFGDSFYEEHVQKNSSTLGIISSGGTIANITALWIARNSCLGPLDGSSGVEEAGVSAALGSHGYAGAVVIGSSLMHYSIDKAAGVLGLGSGGVIRVPVNRDGRMNLSMLPDIVKRCKERRQRIVAIVGVAGSTDCGSIDALQALADIAEQENIHFHVDAAWGAPLVFSRKHKNKLTGIERADSVTADGHKQLHLPVGNSLLLFRNPKAAKVIEKEAPYMLREGSGDLGRRSLEGSRPGSTLFVHAGLSIIGRRGYEFLVDESIRKGEVMARLIRARPEFELVGPSNTNIVLYRFIPRIYRRLLIKGELQDFHNKEISAVNEQIQSIQFQEGRTLVSRTTLAPGRCGHGVTIVALRAVINNPFTCETDMKMVLDDQLRIAAALTEGQAPSELAATSAGQGTISKRK